jgi:thiamine biosynthesis lipoprotein
MSTRIIPPTRRLRLAPILLVAVIVASLALVVNRPLYPTAVEEEVTIGGNTMGGTWSVKLDWPPKKVPPGDIQSILQRHLDDINAALTTYDETSPLRRFNAYRDTDWFPVPPHVVATVLTAERVSEQTGGAFDITVAPLVDLWGFGPQERGVRLGEIPGDAAIAAARGHVDFRKLHARSDPPALRKDDPDLKIDLSAVGKGYAAGVLGERLDLRGGRYLIAVGGELRAKGLGPDGHPWRVGIEVPAPDTRRILRTLELRDAGLSTSGDYRNFVEIAGRRFSHEIDPRTGRPVTGNLASVSVVHPDSAYADAMATGLMVLGPDEGYALAQRLHLAALFVLRGAGRFDTRATPEFERLTVSNPLR